MNLIMTPTILGTTALAALSSLLLIFLLFQKFFYNPFPGATDFDRHDTYGPTKKDVRRKYKELRAEISQSKNPATPKNLSDWKLLILVLWGLGKKSNYSESKAAKDEYQDFEDHILQMFKNGIYRSWEINKPQFYILNMDIWRRVREILDPQDVAELFEVETQCVLDLDDQNEDKVIHASTLVLFYEKKWAYILDMEAKLSEASSLEAARGESEATNDLALDEENPLRRCEQKIKILRALVTHAHKTSALPPMQQSTSSVSKAPTAQVHNLTAHLRSKQVQACWQGIEGNPFKNKNYEPSRADLQLRAGQS